MPPVEPSDTPPGQPTKLSPWPGGRAFVEAHGDYWTRTTTVTALSGSPGQLVLRSSTRPDAGQLFVIERLGHRRRAVELDSANNQLARTVAALRHQEAVQEEFTHLAATGTELDVATSLSRLTE